MLAMERRPLPPDITWKQGSISGPSTIRWLHVQATAVAVVALHNEVWRSTINRHLDVKRERTVPAPSQELAMAWTERWAVANAERIRARLQRDPAGAD
jgi:hypothetical protein